MLLLLLVVVQVNAERVQVSEQLLSVSLQLSTPLHTARPTHKLPYDLSQDYLK